jgi:hypothetical protein
LAGQQALQSLDGNGGTNMNDLDAFEIADTSRLISNIFEPR